MPPSSASAPPPAPPAFDAGHYRAANPDLALPDDAAARRHYEAEGRSQGRIASPWALREALVAAIPADAAALEIGPFCDPLLRGPNVRYHDMLDAAALRARAKALGLDASRCPERIDHVGTFDDCPPDRFDIVLASHAIEHQPDLIRHLAAVARVLRPGGRYLLVVPDRRYCFDHFLADSTVADVLEAYRDGRRTHALRHVVEHGALATHNDPARHWQGDHAGAGEAEVARRSQEALAAFDDSEGGYLDVHAWKFTPDSFRTVFDTLAALDLSAFEIEQVYDTPRDRAEFCAVLRRARAPRVHPRRDHGINVVVLQTADPFRYARMLAVTAPLQIEYCRRHGFRYESFVGIRRGPWSWQATFNRIEMLGDLLDAGFAGWAVYLDADAFVHDLDFDLPGYLAYKGDRGAILATSGVTAQAWDVNAGVALINLGHPQGRRLVEAWRAAFRSISTERLQRERHWMDDDNDQDLLQRILREDAGIAAATFVEAMDVLNSAHARFIRQRVRAQFDSFEDRLRGIAGDVAAVMRANAIEPPPIVARADERERALLLHPVRGRVRLVEAPVATPRPDAAARAIAAWQGWPRDEGLAPNQLAFAAMLAAGEAASMAGELAALGRSAVSQGLLGGARQHRRCATDRVFAHGRALRTADALLSLAELVGAVAVESPEIGAWGETGAIPPPALFGRIEAMLRADLTPPATIGGHLGLAVPGAVLHLRMAEAIYAAWRVRQTIELLELHGVDELGGGVGLAAFYAARLGVHGYRVAGTSLHAAIQHYLLDGEPDGPSVLPLGIADAGRAAALLFSEDDPGLLPQDRVLAHLRGAAAQRARAVLSFEQEASPAGALARPTMAAMLAEAGGGWRRVTRARHGLRPGYVEELYLRS